MKVPWRRSARLASDGDAELDGQHRGEQHDAGKNCG